jgi:type I restriction enzyme S subunit
VSDADILASPGPPRHCSLASSCVPTFREQVAIAEIFSDMDAEVAALEQRRDKTCALKQG